MTSDEGTTLRTFAGAGAGGDVALPGPLVAAVVTLAGKMKLGQLQSLAASYDKLCLVVLNAPPFAATVVAAESVDLGSVLALREGLVAALGAGGKR